MSESTLPCPTCDCHAIVKNGKTRYGQQNYRCNNCPKGRCEASAVAYRFAYGRQFVENPKWRKIFEATIQLIDRLLLEKISLAGIARALEISEPWLQNYVNQKYESVPTQVKIQAQKKEN